jgi:RNA polymerase sigma factor (TIGR02999 family)
MTPDPNLKTGEEFVPSDTTAQSDWTEMLRVWSSSNAPTDRAAAALYGELRRRARGSLARERRDHSLSTTDLVHDVLLRLSQQRVAWCNRSQFCAAVSRTMRRVLVDHARARLTRKRAGVHVEISEDIAGTSPRTVDVLAVNDALAVLAVHDPRQAQLVELRFFGGLTLEEAAATLAISLPTANRDWRFARAWLAQRLGTGRPPKN